MCKQFAKITCECNLALNCMFIQLFVHTRFVIMGVSNLSCVNEEVRDAHYLTSVCVIKQMSVYAICQNRLLMQFGHKLHVHAIIYASNFSKQDSINLFGLKK